MHEEYSYYSKKAVDLDIMGFGGRRICSVPTPGHTMRYRSASLQGTDAYSLHIVSGMHVATGILLSLFQHVCECAPQPGLRANTHDHSYCVLLEVGMLALHLMQCQSRRANMRAVSHDISVHVAGVSGSILYVLFHLHHVHVCQSCILSAEAMSILV